MAVIKRGGEWSFHKSVALLGSASLIAALGLIASRPPASEYEISIYKAYQPHLWLLIGMGLASGVYVLVGQALAETRSDLWLVGFLLIQLTSCIVLLLPLLRGYVFYGAIDPMYHLGFVKDIQSTGHFNGPKTIGENVYPVAHILATSLGYATGLDFKLVIMLLPALFFMFYGVSFYLLSRELALTRAQLLMAIAFGTLPLFGWKQAIFLPSTLTFLLLPFLLFLYQRALMSHSRSINFRILLVPYLIMLPVMHPLDGGLFLLLLLACLFVNYPVQRQYPLREMDVASRLRRVLAARSLNPVAILLIVCLFWFSAFWAFEHGVKSFFNLLALSETGIFKFTRGLQGPASLQLRFIAGRLLIYGPAILYAGLATLTVLSIWLKRSQRRNPHSAGFFVAYLVFGVVALAAFVGQWWFGRSLIALDRLLIYVLLCAAVVNGLNLPGLLEESTTRKVAVSFTTTILVVAGVMAIFNLHPLPLIRGANPQVTAMDLEGGRWFFDHRSEDYLVDQIAIDQRAYQVASMGARYWPRNVRSLTATEEDMPPKHFGYDQQRSYGEAYGNNRYFISNRLSRLGYPEMLGSQFEAFWGWTAADFRRLENDLAVSKLYANGEFEVFGVEGTKPAVR